MLITIDGLSGTGKSWLGWHIAQHLQCNFLSSGFIYRLYAYKTQQVIRDLDENKDPESLLSFEFKNDVRAIYKGADVTDMLLSPQVANEASQLASQLHVRTALIAWQKAYDRQPGLVADGRDMGTVIFPKANKKLFLVASSYVRAKRREIQLKHANINVSIDELVEQIEQRDHRDQSREISPLVPADDAFILDMTHEDKKSALDKCLACIL